MIALALLVAAVVGIVAFTRDDASTPAATSTEATATATAPTDTSTAATDTSTTEDSGASTETAGSQLPADVQADPVLVRLANGRKFPFTVGPWKQAAWRDAVYAKLKPATQAYATKVAVGAGFGIRFAEN